MNRMIYYVYLLTGVIILYKLIVETITDCSGLAKTISNQPLNICQEEVISRLFSDKSDGEYTEKILYCAWSTSSVLASEAEVMLDKYAAWLGKAMPSSEAKVRARAKLETILRAPDSRTASSPCRMLADSADISLVRELGERCAKDEFLTLQLSAIEVPGQLEKFGTPEMSCTIESRELCIVAMNVLRLENAAFLEPMLGGERLREMLESVPQAATAIFLIVQHAPSLQFQRAALDIFAEFAASGLMQGRRVALLTDRVLGKSAGVQRYGTQFNCVDEELQLAWPLEDRSRTDILRRQAGLASLDDERGEAATLCKSNK